MMPLILLFALLAAPSDPAGQTREPMSPAVPDSLPVFIVPGVRVEAPRLERTVHEDPSFLDRLGIHDLRARKQARTLPEALSELPGVMVQKTSHGQGSPFLRGFTGFRTLLLIDGIRLNNSVFRDGPNQYWSTVDPMLVSRMDVVRGPSAVLQGTDAVGGLVNVSTADWKQFDARHPFTPRLQYRFAGAEHAHVGRLEAGGRLSPRAGYVAGMSLRSYGDLEGGADVGRQRKTGYDEFDGDLRLDFDLTERWSLAAAHQNTSVDDAWRTHRTVYGISWEGTTIGNDKVHTFDQGRQLTYLQVKGHHLAPRVREVLFSVSWHRQDEDRLRVRADDRRDVQGFEVGTAGVWGEVRGRLGGADWTLGADLYRDHVDSWSRRYAADGSLQVEELQGPVADDAVYDLAGIFARSGIPLATRLTLHLGARYTHAAMNAEKVADPVTGERLSVEGSWNKLVESGRLAWVPDADAHWTLYAGMAQAFRAPNLSDLTRFDIARSNEIEVPSPDLEPENFVTVDLGAKWITDRLALQLAVFRTDIDGMIVRVLTGRTIDGNMEVTKRNAGAGFMTGVEGEVRYRFEGPWEAFASVGKTYGEVDGDFVDKMPPLAGTLGLLWRPNGRGWIEAGVSLAERQDQLSERDRSDTQRIPPGGTPGFAAFTFRGGWELPRVVSLSLAVENLTDRDYRIHGSGQNEPGVNLVTGLRLRF